MYQPTATLEPTPASRLPLAIGLGAWLSITLAVAVSGVMGAVPQIIAPTAFGAVAAGVIAYRRNGALRALADRIDLRIPILLHVIRAPIGAQILLSTGAGIVPELFGHRAGPGDIAIGVLALAAVLAVPATSALRRRVLVAWCVLGILDLAVAFSTAQYLLFVAHDPRVMLIGSLPWSLLPTVVVPAMILTHLLVLARVRRGA